ncbi:MAG TPA: zf-HC2 domain-containing protein [Blastocatellia bacterium]|nr:zf-HC2 domain-containing protein [Blastocatellia bacterium]
MQHMQHEFSDEEWDDYLTGRITPAARARIDAHLIACPECWQLYEEQVPTMRDLIEAAEEARARLTLSDQRLRAMFSQVVAEIHRTESDSSAQVRHGLDSLKSLLIPVFGPEVAHRAMHLAATRSLDQVTPEGWNPFLERLAGITSIICGDVFAGLIREHGQAR